MNHLIIRRSTACRIQLSVDDWQQLSSPEKIARHLMDENVLAFDICQEEVIGFAMVRKFAERSYFLWNFAITTEKQQQGLGSQALRQLISLLKSDYQAQVLTTTYLAGNECARHVYEKIGFVETDVVVAPDIHEVNLRLALENFAGNS